MNPFRTLRPLSTMYPMSPILHFVAQSQFVPLAPHCSYAPPSCLCPACAAPSATRRHFHAPAPRFLRMLCPPAHCTLHVVARISGVTPHHWLTGRQAGGGKKVNLCAGKLQDVRFAVHAGAAKWRRRPQQAYIIGSGSSASNRDPHFIPPSHIVPYVRPLPACSSQHKEPPALSPSGRPLQPGRTPCPASHRLPQRPAPGSSSARLQAPVLQLSPGLFSRHHGGPCSHRIQPSAHGERLIAGLVVGG